MPNCQQIRLLLLQL